MNKQLQKYMYEWVSVIRDENNTNKTTVSNIKSWKRCGDMEIFCPRQLVLRDT